MEFQFKTLQRVNTQDFDFRTDCSPTTPNIHPHSADADLDALTEPKLTSDLAGVLESFAPTHERAEQILAA